MGAWSLMGTAALVAALLFWRPWAAPTPALHEPTADAPSKARVPGRWERTSGHQGSDRPNAPSARPGLSGVVVDRQGRALSGVEVTAVPAPPAVAASTETDGLGKFHLPRAPDQELRLLLHHPEFLFENRAVEPGAGDSMLVELRRRPVVMGRVVDAVTGAEVPDFCVVLAAREDRAPSTVSLPPPGAEWSHDVAGAFRVTSEFAGPHALRVFTAHACVAQLLLELEPGAVVEREVAVQPAVRPHGLLRDAAGVPVAGASINLRALPARGGSVTTTGVDGSFEFPPLAPGPYGLTAQAHGRPALQRDDLRLELARPRPFLDLQLPEGAALAGVVRPWQAGQQAEVVTRHIDGPIRRAPVDVATGRYSLSELTPGRHHVVVERGEPSWRSRVARQLFDPAVAFDVELRAGRQGVFDPVDPVATMARRRGRVTGRSRPEQLVVRAWYEGRPMPARAAGLFRATPRADGSFVIDGFVPGPWRVQIQSGGEVLHWEVLDFSPNADLEHVFAVVAGRPGRGR